MTLPGRNVWAVQKAITGWVCKRRKMPSRGDAFVAEQRELPGNPKEITSMVRSKTYRPTSLSQLADPPEAQRTEGLSSHTTPRSNVTSSTSTRVLRSIMTNKKELQKIEPDTTVEVKKAR
jgi:hypothetical protein